MIPHVPAMILHQHLSDIDQGQFHGTHQFQFFFKAEWADCGAGRGPDTHLMFSHHTDTYVWEDTAMFLPAAETQELCCQAGPFFSVF